MPHYNIQISIQKVTEGDSDILGAYGKVTKAATPEKVVEILRLNLVNEDYEELISRAVSIIMPE